MPCHSLPSPTLSPPSPLQLYVRQKNLVARRKSSVVSATLAAVAKGPLTKEEKARVQVWVGGWVGWVVGEIGNEHV